MFNMPSDLAEIRRLIEGIGAEVNLSFPLGSSLDDVPYLADADANVCLYREFGRGLCEILDRPICRRRSASTPRRPSCARSGEVLGLDPEPFIAREKHTTIKPLWDLWRSVTQDFFAHRVLRRRGQRDLHARHPRLPRRATWACPARFAVPRRAGAKTDNAAVKARSHRPRRRSWCSARSTSACISPRAAAGRIFIPASFPGAAIRRHTGTPYMGYCGRHLPGAGGVQRALRRAVPHHPAGRADGRRRGHARRGRHAELPWDDDARAGLDHTVEAEPVHRPDLRRQAPARRGRTRGAAGRSPQRQPRPSAAGRRSRRIRPITGKRRPVS